MEGLPHPTIITERTSGNSRSRAVRRRAAPVITFPHSPSPPATAAIAAHDMMTTQLAARSVELEAEFITGHRYKSRMMTTLNPLARACGSYMLLQEASNIFVIFGAARGSWLITSHKCDI